MNPIDLPLNWQTVKFGTVATFTKKPKNLRYAEYNEIPFVPMNLIPIATLFSKKFIRKPSDKISSGTYFEPGDILLAKITPSFENGKQCIIKELPTPFGIATTEVIPIREVEGVSDKIYLFYYLLRPDVRALLAKRMQGTTGRLRLGTKTLAELEIPLPPLAEQERIVAKLEMLFAQLDAAADSLKKTHAQLQRYRRSILKAAFEGELTRKWREAHSSELEPMSISKTITSSNLPELPDGWVWTPLKEISEIILGQSPPSSTYNTDGEGLPFYQGKLEFGKLYPTPRKWCTAPKKFAKKGDVFISIRAPVGPTNLCYEKSAVGRGLAAIRGLNGIQPFFILHLLRRFESEIASRGTGTTFNAITGNQLKTFQIPLPPLAEQEQIVSELEQCFSAADEVEATITSELSRAESLRQSILKHAFSGKLVPQDPNDEPASVLLEKIREEKKQQPKQRKKTAKSKAQDSDDYPLLGLAGALEQNGDSIGDASRVEARGGKGE